MDESGEAIEGGRGISLKGMLRACSRHCASTFSISYEEPICSRSGIGQVEAIVSRRKRIALHGFVLKGPWDDSMVDDLILSI